MVAEFTDISSAGFCAFKCAPEGIGDPNTCDFFVYERQEKEFTEYQLLFDVSARLNNIFIFRFATSAVGTSPPIDTVLSTDPFTSEVWQFINRDIDSLSNHNPILYSAYPDALFAQQSIPSLSGFTILVTATFEKVKQEQECQVDDTSTFVRLTRVLLVVKHSVEFC